MRFQSCAIASMLAIACSSAASAQTVEAFYAGRTIDLVVGFPPGGGYDLFARPIARRLGRFLPGNPNLVIRYMPGAGSLVAANHAYSIAPKDGTVLAIISPTGPLEARLNPANVKFTASHFNWIGRIGPQAFVAMIWHTSPVRTIEQARTTEVAFGTTGVGSGTQTYPAVTNSVLGTRFKLVTGYKGSADALLAMERGEVQAHATGIELIKTSRPEWLATKKVHLFTQFTVTRHPIMPDVPAVVEFARNHEEAAVLKAVMSAAEIGRAVLTTPGVPVDRVAALRAAFEEMLKDQEFVAELRKSEMDVIPMPGAQIGKLVDELERLPPATIEKIRQAYNSGR